MPVFALWSFSKEDTSNKVNNSLRIKVEKKLILKNIGDAGYKKYNATGGKKI